ncbi:hypothetical protein ACF3MZ_09600 [Paenibacillaceae bacterium WGS1546]
MDDKNEASNTAPANEERFEQAKNRRENERPRVKSEQIRYENADEIYE